MGLSCKEKKIDFFGGLGFSKDRDRKNQVCKGDRWNGERMWKEMTGIWGHLGNGVETECSESFLKSLG